MASVEPITLYREKTTVHRFSDGDDASEDQAALMIRSNRISLTMRASNITEVVVIRGQNIASTLRLAGLVIEQFRRDSTTFRKEEPTDWAEIWRNRLSSYERQFNPESWVSIHVQGRPVFSNNDDPTIDEIERLASGDEVSEELIRTATASLLGSAEDLVIQHDSQTAVVFTPFQGYHRVAVLERRGGRTGSFAMSAHHPAPPKKTVRYSGFVNFSADVIEALNLKAFLDRIKQMVEENRMSGPPITPSQVAAAMARKRDLMQFIVAYERANKITYRPERPEFY